MKEILVCAEKHNTYYYDVSTKEQLHKACVAVLKRRLKDGCYNLYEPDNNSGFKSMEEISTLAEGSVKKYALQEWGQYQKELSDYKKEKNNLSGIKAVIKMKWDDEKAWYGLNKDRSVAFMYLSMRREYEYEECLIEALDEVE